MFNFSSRNMLALCGLLAMHSGAVSACSCAGGIPLQQSIKNSDSIFAGKVVKISSPKTVNREIIFEVTDVWKGKIRQTTQLYTGLGDGDCGFPFRMNTAYLVYARAENKSVPYTGLCSATKPLSQAKADLKLLGPSSAPLPGAASLARLMLVIIGGTLVGLLCSSKDGKLLFSVPPGSEATSTGKYFSITGLKSKRDGYNLLNPKS